MTWIERDDHGRTPGKAAYAAATELPVPDRPFYGWAVGEQALASGKRKHWTRAGVPKTHIMFCGYWRAAAH
ncbi:siderophore-interacting protein [Herbihabitans rhizosphaerae]|uniref:Siderophore-interacting protein n=1 Tax=Herbihabitans rhizosphaerae TaxID=1872711 RepID=A0A4Q7KQN3_9PSEU|nr:SIP domain-containing protein [Herbihabitans rhizosphaerae]RZS37632.1 siderophore-interacting protein [Herbihabitans rhizosphaerae]